MPVTDRDRAKVLALVQDGRTRGEVARQTGVAPTTVSRIAKDAGFKFGQQLAPHIHDAHKASSRERRKALADKLLGKLEDSVDFLAKEGDPRAFLAYSQGLDALARAYTNVAKLQIQEDDQEHVKGIAEKFIESVARVAHILPPINADAPGTPPPPEMAYKSWDEVNAAK